MTILSHSLTKLLFRKIPAIFVACVVISAWAQMGQMAQRPYAQQGPIAIGTLPSGVIVVLGSRGGLSLINPATGLLTPIKETLGNVTPLDLSVARIGNQEFIFVTAYWAISAQSMQSNQGLVVQYSLQGNEIHRWSSLGRTFGGLVVDGDNQAIYLGSAGNEEISKLSIRDRAFPEFIARVAGSSRLGPLALDTDGHRLFVCDVEGGNVYMLDLASHKSRALAYGIGSPAALAYHPAQHRLYVADASGHRVLQLATDAQTTKVSTYSSAPEFREPRGLTIGPDQSLWVADYGARAVFQLSATGQVIRIVR